MNKTIEPSSRPDANRHPVSGATIAWTLADQLVPARCALLVIDMQNDFTGERGLLARTGRDPILQRAIIPNINTLVGAARDTGVPVIWVRTSHAHHDSRPNYLAVYLRTITQNRWDPAHLLVAQGSEGGQWHPDLMRRQAHEPELTKHGYSAFCGTALTALLRARNTQTLILTGVNTNVCLQSTAADGFQEGYYPVLCDDASATASQALHEAALETHRGFYGLTASMREIVDAWRSAGNG